MEAPSDMQLRFRPVLHTVAIALASIAGATAVAVPAAGEPSRSFASTGSDASAIGTLLATYARAVSTKNEALFETLLLDRDIPFSYVGRGNARLAAGPDGTHRYDEFRSGVFGGPPFTQTFSDVHVLQDGSLAEVSLVFTNRSASGAMWGWKTMQLVKVGGTWKIASEFFTGHATPAS